MSFIRISELSPLKLAVAAKQLMPQLDILKAEPIAVIGMGCRFPGGADDPVSYWNVLKNGTDGIVEIPHDRWNMNEYYDPDPDKPGKIYCRYGGFLKNVDTFDARFFGISRREAESLDPQQRVLLEVTWEALEHANQSQQHVFGKSVGLYIGISTFDYASRRMSLQAPDRIDAYYVSGTVLSAAAGRLSYILGLTGPSMSVDTACSSSLVSVHLACQSLRNRECNMAIAGGVGLILAPEPSINFCKAKMLSPDGRCKTFDASADGYSRGEGCGVIILKRLSDAIADKDIIHAIVRGSAVNQDGPSGGLTVPNGPSQEQVIRQALTCGGIESNWISYIEAHGTGTSLGDPIEVNSLGNVFCQEPRKSPLWIGSVKTNFGHLEAAAGIAGIIKVILSLQHKQIPPHLHFKTPNPHIAWDQFTIKIPTALTDWTSIDNRRIAGVSSFGFAGTNAHVVLEEFSAFLNSEHKQKTEHPHVLLISAKTPEALQTLAQRYVHYFSNYPNSSLDDVCFTACNCRSFFSHRLAVMAHSKQLLCQKLSAFINNTAIDGIFTSQFDEDGHSDISVMFPLFPQDAKNIWQQYRDTTSSYQKTILPPYPFQRERYWIDTTVTYSSSPHTKLPGQKMYIPFSKEIHFETQFGLGTPSYIKDHRLFGTLVVAGASHIAMLLNAANEIFNSDACMLTDLLFQQPLILKDNEIKTLHIALKPIENTYNVKLVSTLTPKKNNWQIHLTGNIVGEIPSGYSSSIPRPSHLPDGKGVIAPDETWTEEPASSLYAEIQTMGHHLGDSFRRIEKIFTKNTQVLCQLKSPDIPDVSDYQLHPGIIDSCFQFFCIRGNSVLFGKHITNSKEVIYVPFSVEEIRFYNSPDKNRILWCYIQVKDKDDTNSLIGDISLFNEIGQPVAEIKNFIARPLKKEDISLMLTDPRESNWLYQVVWQKKEREKSEIQRQATSNWLILNDHKGLGQLLSDTLQRQNHNCTLVSSSHLHHLAWEQETVSNYDDIVYLQSLDEAHDIVEPLMRLITNILLMNTSKMPRLWLITKNTQPVGNETLFTQASIWQSMIWGLAHVITLEHRDMPCIRIDIGQNDSAVDILIEEFLKWDGEDQIAWRNGIRYVPRLTYFKEQKSSLPIQIRPDCTYLITGGTGALGLRTAQWLSENKATHVVLSARKPPFAEAKEKIAQIERNGTVVTVILGDISNKEHAEQMFKEMRNALPPLKGILHLAGIIDDATLLTLGQHMERFHRVLAPKVQGTWNLHTLSSDIPLDFFVCFSSAASLIGSAGQGNYAAANAFMDALAHYRRLLGLPCISINWGAWAEIGMAATMSKREHERIAQQGLRMITPKTGLAILEKLLNQDAVQVAVLPIHWPTYISFHYGTDIPPFFSIISDVKQKKSDRTPRIIQKLTYLTRQERRDVLEHFVRETVAFILKASSLQEIDIRQGFFEMGFDSLMAVELKNMLEVDIGKPLRSTLVFNYPNIEAITDYLISDVLGSEFTDVDDQEETDSDTDSENDFGNMIGKKLADIEKFLNE
ncbi:MAG: SDR family NAD(P)-dependent oxidoreductase [Desulfobacterales bacterium]|nr:SDR family NAD(P)-dependent oxidoreductase [Desulfobacterales bacterium]